MKNNRKVCVCLPHGGSAAVGCLSMRAGSMGRENHCGHQVPIVPSPGLESNP